MIRRHLVVMLKEPRAGRVKTRLGREIGMTSAAWWFRHQTARLLRELDDPRWDLVLAVSPDHAAYQSRAWPSRFKRIPQGAGTLGDRMARIFRTRHKGPICIIGGDIPGITPNAIEKAFRALGHHDAVFGPAPDGGFWLVGLKRVQPAKRTLFDGVRWSSPHALQDSLNRMPGQSVALVDTLKDVDTASDLKHWHHAGRR